MAHPDHSGRLPRDPAFKAIFSYSRMIADALRGYAVKPNGPLHPRTVAALDLCTLEKLPAEWITPDFRKRLGDQAWRVRFRWARDWSDPGGYLLILVEFQSRPHRDMGSRMAGYAVRLLEDLQAAGVVRPGAPRPPIFPLVIHNGPGRWTAPTTLDGLTATPAPPAAAASPDDVEDARLAARDLDAFRLRHAYFPLDFQRYREDDPRPDNAMSLLIGLESATSLDGLLPPLGFLPGLPERELAQTMLAWTLLRLGVDSETAEEMTRMASLDEFHSQLEERAQGWTEQWFAEGMERGRAEGIEQGIVQGIERGIEQGIERGMEQGIERGIVQGMERGRAEGVAAQRDALRRQAAVRFGVLARLLDTHLEGVGSSAKLAEIGEWLMVDTIDELIAKIKATAAECGID